jgi:hypothetical protein
MEENNSFKNKALSHIPKSVVDSMMRQESLSIDGLSPLEAIAKTLGKGPLPQKSESSIQPQFMTIAINDVALKVPTDPWQASMTMLMYLAATVWAKDKKVAKVLKAFNFSLQDANGAILYPKQKQSKGKK